MHRGSDLLIDVDLENLWNTSTKARRKNAFTIKLPKPALYKSAQKV